jgi:chromosomal replication initiation ATPase DnaA
MDIRAGAQGIASPVDAIILEVCAAFGGTNHSEVVAMNERRATAARVRSAALWVVKKRLPNWTDDQIATAFHAKDRSTVSKGIQRAEQNRAEDNEFKRLTDNLLAQPPLRCENCQHALEPA